MSMSENGCESDLKPYMHVYGDWSGDHSSLRQENANRLSHIKQGDNGKKKEGVRLVLV